MNSRPPAELSAETSPEGAARRRARQGLTLGLLAYISWGSFPAFFKLLNAATPLEVVSHRIFWSAAFLLLLVGLSHRLGPLWRVLRDRGTLLTLGGSTLLIAANWSVFILAVQRGQVLQSSLGYFMTPLISVLLGFLFLREKLTLWQRISVGLAALGVLNLALQHGSIPWIALVLATTFGLYGLLRKLARVDALLGLTIETLLLTPFALGYLIYLQFTEQGVFLAGSPDLNLLLPLAGVVTALPLLGFIGAARRLRLSTIGFLQYITPSLHFLLAVGLYNEAFSRSHLISFLCIWAALAVYTSDALWQGMGRGSDKDKQAA
ncbi:EamA family transporter RarD [Trichloromonas acetexigens]|uniref:EamA family transporter RarD n=1 Tax=Trichloromonas acetexigens TaxID=38815 RepID=A0A550J782_9BACT|nr:EamA family transporter RarD [Desulfuromonas acetexigens]TRO79089.1 EamA family transporter RarD [Desulfuromonas acetexigens]